MALLGYYGNGFRANVLPTSNIESIDRSVVSDALKRATQNTSKGRYQKIRDGARLLERIDSEVVSNACPSCAALFRALGQILQRA